jgi:hypothetical protein
MDWDSVELEWIGATGAVCRAGIDEYWDIEFEAVSPIRRFPSYRGQRNYPGFPGGGAGCGGLWL